MQHELFDKNFKQQSHLLYRNFLVVTKIIVKKVQSCLRTNSQNFHLRHQQNELFFTIIITQLQNKMQYSPAFVYPPVIQDCEIHRLACRIFKGNSKDAYNFEQCKCCGRTVGEEDPKIATCYDPTKELTFLGPGVPLLFNFMRMAIFILIFLSLQFTIYTMISNIQGNSCTLPNCTPTIFTQLSLANKISKLQNLLIQNYLSAAFIISFAIMLQYLIFIIRKTDKICDQIINTPSDYSILINELPQDVTQSDIKKMIEHQRWFLDDETRNSSRNLSIKDIIMSYNLQRYVRDINKQEEEFMKKKKKDEHSPFIIKQIPLPSKYQKFAIVIFNRQSSKDWFTTPPNLFQSIRNFLCHLCRAYNGFSVKDKMVVIQRAPEPDDIIWKNSHISQQSIICNKIISNFCCLVILFLGGILQYFLQLQKNNFIGTQFESYFNLISSISINVFNFIIVQFLIFSTNKEGDITLTQRNSSLLVKICIYQFFNAGVFYIFAHVLADEKTSSVNIQGTYAQQIIVFMTISAVLPTTLNIIFTKCQFPKVIQRFCFLKGCIKYSQKDANTLFQRTEIQFPIKYGYVIRTVWLTCFYACFSPIVVPISLVGIIYFYYAQKFLFKKDYSVPFMLSNRIVYTAFKLLIFTGFIMFAGSTIITVYLSFKLQTFITLQDAIPLIISLIVSILIIFLPCLRINGLFFKFQIKHTRDPTYDEASQQFAVTYKGTNPVSSYNQTNKRGEISLMKSFGVMSNAIQMQIKNILGQDNNTQLLNETNNPFNVFAGL